MQVGSLATLDMDETDIEVDDDIGTIDLDFDANSTFEGIADVEVAGVGTTLQITMGAESEFPQATDYVVVDIAGGSDAGRV